LQSRLRMVRGALPAHDKFMSGSGFLNVGMRDAATCGSLWCHHRAVLDVDAFADDVTVPSFGPRNALATN